jgi:hypothetical protein
LLEAGEAVGDGLAVLVLGVLEECGSLGGLEERRPADLALDVASLRIDFELRLGRLGLVLVALALLLCLGSVTHVCGGA